MRTQQESIHLETINTIRDAYYRQNLETFLSYTNENQVVVDYLVDRIGREKPNFATSRTWKMLDIGGGPGSKTFDFVARLKRDWQLDIRITNVDPCREWHDEYRERAKSLGLEHTIDQMIACRWEEFDLSETFDFILCSHSIYGIHNWDDRTRDKNGLVKITRAIKPGGMACVVVQSRNNVVYLVQSALASLVKDENEPACGDSVWSAIRRFGIRADITRDTAEWLDVCFLDEGIPSPSAVGYDIMSLMLLFPKHAYGRLQPHLRARFESLVADHSSQTEKSYTSKCHSTKHRIAPVNDDFIWLLQPTHS